MVHLDLLQSIYAKIRFQLTSRINLFQIHFIDVPFFLGQNFIDVLSLVILDTNRKSESESHILFH